MSTISEQKEEEERYVKCQFCSGNRWLRTSIETVVIDKTPWGYLDRLVNENAVITFRCATCGKGTFEE